jgi:MFS family permease
MLSVQQLNARVQRGFNRTFDALGNQRYRYLWGGMFFSMAALQVSIVSRAWLAYDLSGSALVLGMVAAARGLPQLLLAPLAGVVADRVDKRRLLLVTQSSLVALGLLVAVLVHTGLIQVWQLVAVGLVQGCLFPFTMPARAAIVPDLVPEHQVSNALALDSTGQNMNRVLAPAVAGLLIAWQPTIAFYAVALLYAGAVLTLLHLPSGLRGTAPRKGTFADMAVGFRYIAGQPALLGLILLAFVPILFGMPFQQLLPVFQKDILEVGPRSLGFMYAAVGIGAITGSLLAAYFSNSPQLGRLQVGAGALFGLAVAAFALSRNFTMTLLILIVAGFASQGYLTINRVLVIMRTDRALYGRVMSVYMMTWSLMPISLLPIGYIVDRAGAPATLTVSGLVLTAFVIIIALSFPQLYLRRTLPPPTPVSSSHGK